VNPGRFEPKIIGFLCDWCSYEGADSAGRGRKVYPANLRFVRVMCSGRVDPTFLFQALSEGADGVLVLGCLPGDCRYKKGNFQCFRRHLLIRKVLPQLGIEEERVRLDWVSAGDADRFVKVVSETVEVIRMLGPLKGPPKTGAPIGGGETLNVSEDTQAKRSPGSWDSQP